MGTATTVTTTSISERISVADTFAEVALSLQDCLLAGAAARAAGRATLPAIRLAVRCLATLMRLARLQPAHIPATISHIRRVQEVADTEFHATNGANLALLAVRITCQTHLTRLAEIQQRPSKRAQPTHRTDPPMATATTPSAPPAAPAPTKPLGAATTTHHVGNSAPQPPPLAPMSQRAKWLAEQEHKQAKRGR